MLLYSQSSCLYCLHLKVTPYIQFVSRAQRMEKYIIKKDEHLLRDRRNKYIYANKKKQLLTSTYLLYIRCPPLHEHVILETNA